MLRMPVARRSDRAQQTLHDVREYRTDGADAERVGDKNGANLKRRDDRLR